MNPSQIAERIQAAEVLDKPVATIEKVVDAMPESTRRFLSGEWLGHPLHPALTDMPIGFWTTSWLLDLLGGKRSARTSTIMVGLGLATAGPTAAAGLVDFPTMPQTKRRAAVLHMLFNTVTTVLYALSFLSRLRGKRAKGIALGMVAATTATAGAYLGGHLAYGSAAPAAKGDDTVTGTTSTNDITPLQIAI
jgi:uncharacterized membrane protein